MARVEGEEVYDNACCGYIHAVVKDGEGNPMVEIDKLLALHPDWINCNITCEVWSH